MSGAVLIGPPTPTAGGANLVLSSQPQFTPAPYPPYHTAAAHLASSRSTLIAAHATPTALPPGPAFRPPTYNGEILYPYTGVGPTIAFLTTAAAPLPAPGAQNMQQTMRSAAQTTQQPPPPQPQQQPQQQQQQQQKVPPAYTPPAAVTGVVPPPTAAVVPVAVPVVPHPPAASTPTGSLYSPLSCFNCGSQKHTGLECQESSMEDVTRNSIYKLDYLSASAGGTPSAVPAQPPNVGPPPSSASPSASLVVSSGVVLPAAAALSASVSVSRMSLVDTAKSQDAAEPSPSPVHHSTSSATATTLPLTPSQQSLVDASTSVSTQTINNQTDSSSSSTISK